MSYNIDMSTEDYSKQGKGGPEFAPGYYDVTVKKVDVKESKTVDEHTSKPAKYFEWTLAFTAGPYLGKTIIARTTAIKGKRWLLKSLLECCGISPAEGKYAFDIADLVGKRVVVKIAIKEEEWTSAKDGKKRTAQKSVPESFHAMAPAGAALNNTL